MDITMALQRGELGHLATITGTESIRAHLALPSFQGFTVPEEVAAAATQLLVYGRGDTPMAVRLLGPALEVLADVAPAAEPDPPALADAQEGGAGAD